LIPTVDTNVEEGINKNTFPYITVRESLVGITCSTHKGDEKCIQRFARTLERDMKE
jgi:hypothetical protein